MKYHMLDMCDLINSQLRAELESLGVIGIIYIKNFCHLENTV